MASTAVAEFSLVRYWIEKPLSMLKAGDTASPEDTQRLLRISIALVWIWTGIVSLGWYPTQDSYALLARVGITGALAPVMLYGAAVLDLLVGIGTLVLRRRRWLWLLQLAVIGGYTLIITFKLPEFWLHPYGPLSKNLPMLAAIYLLYTLEGRRWNTSS